jgi:hypothetical protein
MSSNCIFEGCERAATRKGYCQKHYARIWRNGDLVLRKRERKCSIEGCERIHFSNDFCLFHNARYKRTGDPLQTKKRGRMNLTSEEIQRRIEEKQAQKEEREMLKSQITALKEQHREIIRQAKEAREKRNQLKKNVSLEQQKTIHEFMKQYETFSAEKVKIFLNIHIKESKIKLMEISKDTGINIHSMCGITKRLNKNHPSYKPEFEMFLKLCNYLNVSIFEILE